MKEQFVTYEIALKLKELGFDEECFKLIEVKNSVERVCVDNGYSKYKNNIGDKQFYFKNTFNNGGEYYVTIPLWQQVIDWFREKHSINIEVNYLPNIVKYATIVSDMKIRAKNLTIKENFLRGNDVTSNFSKFETYEKAREFAILKAIELIKQL